MLAALGLLSEASESTKTLPTTSFSRKNTDRLLVLCPNETIASALSFQAAYELALHQPTQHILFICVRQRFELNPPPFVSIRETEDVSGSTSKGNNNSNSSGFFWNPQALSRIAIKYVTSLASLKSVLTSTHTMRPPISAIVVDNLRSVLDSEGSLYRGDSIQYERVVQAIHFLGDAVNFLVPLTSSNLDHTTKAKTKSTTNGSSHNNNDNIVGPTSNGLRLLVTESGASATYLSAIRPIFCSRNIVCRPTVAVSSVPSSGVGPVSGGGGWRRSELGYQGPPLVSDAYASSTQSAVGDLALELLYREGIREWNINSGGTADLRDCYPTGLTLYQTSPSTNSNRSGCSVTTMSLVIQPPTVIM